MEEQWYRGVQTRGGTTTRREDIKIQYRLIKYKVWCIDIWWNMIRLINEEHYIIATNMVHK